jgi:hypothetical protein
MCSREEDERLVEVKAAVASDELNLRWHAESRTNHQCLLVPASSMKWHAQVGSTNGRIIQFQTAERFNSIRAAFNP